MRSQPPEYFNRHKEIGEPLQIGQTVTCNSSYMVSNGINSVSGKYEITNIDPTGRLVQVDNKDRWIYQHHFTAVRTQYDRISTPCSG
jgi:hypothetical protein